jgi:hypothetical protein
MENSPDFRAASPEREAGGEGTAGDVFFGMQAAHRYVLRGKLGMKMRIAGAGLHPLPSHARAV